MSNFDNHIAKSLEKSHGFSDVHFKALDVINSFEYSQSKYEAIKKMVARNELSEIRRLNDDYHPVVG